MCIRYITIFVLTIGSCSSVFSGEGVHTKRENKLKKVMKTKEVKAFCMIMKQMLDDSEYVQHTDSSCDGFCKKICRPSRLDLKHDSSCESVDVKVLISAIAFMADNQLFDLLVKTSEHKVFSTLASYKMREMPIETISMTRKKLLEAKESVNQYIRATDKLLQGPLLKATYPISEDEDSPTGNMVIPFGKKKIIIKKLKNLKTGDHPKYYLDEYCY